MSMKPKMAVSGFHFRSVSLPSRVQPINASKIESLQLQQLNSCHVSNSLPQTAPINSQAIQSDLQMLAELYNSVEEAAKSAATQQRKPIEESLERSIELIDSCNIIRELLLMIKEKVQALQSALRRKGLDYSRVQYDIITYTCFRKRTSKSIAKTLKTLNSLEKKNGSSEDQSFVGVLREVALLTVASFKRILLFLSSPTAKRGGRSLVPRLVFTKSVAYSSDDHSVINSEVGSVDFALGKIQGRIRNDGASVLDVQNLQRNLRNFDACMQEFETGLERLFRLLVRSRVTVLNILTDQLK